MTKAEIPAAIPASAVSARAGLAARSARTVSPAGTDVYSELVNNEPAMNSNAIAMIRPTDHFPEVLLGEILNGCLAT